jgi:protein-S-isoprenylcysteine O-methyltransferase Ste14
MQFGRIYGIGLIVLGLVLLVLQFVQYLNLPKEVGPTQTETRTVKNTQHLTSSWPGFIGVGSLVAGIAVFITARRKEEPNPKYKGK